MQTFLPYPSFTKSAQSLDGKRLNKQRIECLQIYDTLTGVSQGWKNHPAVRMWRGYEEKLIRYWFSIEAECRRRNYKSRDIPQFKSFYAATPSWLGNEEFHLSHRLNLLFKDPVYYQMRFTEDVPKTKPDYVWPG